MDTKFENMNLDINPLVKEAIYYYCRSNLINFDNDTLKELLELNYFDKTDLNNLFMGSFKQYEDDEMIVGLQLIIDAGADINTQDENEDTVLHLICQDAVMQDDYDLKDFIMKNNPKLDIRNRRYKVPLECALESGYYEGVAAIINALGSKSIQFNTLRKYKGTEMAEELEETYGIDISLI